MSGVAYKAPELGSGRFSGCFEIHCGSKFNESQSSRWNQDAFRAKFIDVSSDGESLVFSKLGSEIFGDPNLVDEVFKSRKILGEYSEDSKRKFVNDRSYLSFLLVKYLPDRFKKQKIVDVDLNVFERGVECYSDKEPDLNNLLTWIINNVDILKKEMCMNENENLSEGGKFVVLKNVLTDFFEIPYFHKFYYKIYVTCFKGLIYLISDYDNRPRPTNITWSNKFKQRMTKDDTSKKVVCDESFRVVLSCSLGPHKLLYSTSLDCANPEEFDCDFTDLSAFMQLKCCEEFSYAEWKSLKWYMNYITTGVSKVLVGYRNQEEIVWKLRLYESQELLQMGKDFWNPSNCLIFTSKLLSFIKSRVESDPGAVFCIRKESRRAEVTCTKEPGVENFLPIWFQNHILEATDVHKAN